ncbi:MAK10-like protein [Tanacetum coccineum]
MFNQIRLDIGLNDAFVELPKFNNWLSSLLRNKEKLEGVAITTVNAECSAIIMNKVPEKLEDPGKFLIPCALQELDRTTLTPTRMTLELANRFITHPMGIAEDVVVRVDGFTFLADFVVVNFEPDPRVPIILGRPFLRTAKALIDLYEETLTLRVGKEELVYYADKSEKNKDKNFVHAISVIDFSKADPFSGSTTNILPPSSSPMKTSDNFEKFADELAPLDSLPPGNDDSTIKKDLLEENFHVYSNPLFNFDDNFQIKREPLFEEIDKDVGLSLLLPSHLLHRKKVNLKLILKEIRFHRELILPPLPPLKFQVAILLPLLSPERRFVHGRRRCFSLSVLGGVRFVWKMMNRISIRKKIICLLATYLHQKPKLLSRPQEVEEIKIDEEKFSSDVPINTIVMPIRITVDNPIDFNDHFSKPKDLKKDLTVALDSTNTSILPPPLLDSDWPFTVELSASITLNSFGNEDKVFKPGTDISKITRKPSKTGKHGHEKRKSTREAKDSKPKPRKSLGEPPRQNSFAFRNHIHPNPQPQVLGPISRLEYETTWKHTPKGWRGLKTPSSNNEMRLTIEWGRYSDFLKNSQPAKLQKRSDEEEPPKEVDMKNEVERKADDKPAKSAKENVTKNEEDELVGASSSQAVEYYLKHIINEKLIEGLLENYRDVKKNMNALIDQGSDMNVMPFSIYNKLIDERPAETGIRISLASHSYIYPLGIAKDVSVDVASYVYPINFVVLDIREDEKRPFIFGTPFLTIVTPIEKRIKNDIEPIAPTMTVNRLVLEWEEWIKLHQEKGMEFDQ